MSVYFQHITNSLWENRQALKCCSLTGSQSKISGPQKLPAQSLNLILLSDNYDHCVTNYSKAPKLIKMSVLICSQLHIIEWSVDDLNEIQKSNKIKAFMIEQNILFVYRWYKDRWKLKQGTYSHKSIPFSRPPLKSLSPKHLPVTAYSQKRRTVFYFGSKIEWGHSYFTPCW